jgi:hypothetical protein
MGESFRCPICKEKWKSRRLYTEIEGVIYIDVIPQNQLKNNENATETEYDDDKNDPDWNENDFDRDWSIY